MPVAKLAASVIGGQQTEAVHTDLAIAEEQAMAAMDVLEIELERSAYVPQPNWSFNADANTGHAFGIFTACVGTLRTSCSGAG